MNKIRREQLAKLSEEIDSLSSQIEGLMNEEQNYYDNMPESLQDGEKGEIAQTAIENMESALNSLSEASNSIDEAQG